MSAIINGSSPSVTFSDGTTQATSAIVSGYVPYANLPAGSVLQVVNATTTSQTATSSTSYGATSLTASITPKFSTSKILVISNYELYVAIPTIKTITGLYRGASLISDGCAMLLGVSSSTQATVGFNYLDSPATTSSTTYAIYLKSSSNGSAVYFNPDGYIAGITLMEIAG